MEFKGVYTAILTPFSKDGKNIDYGAYKEIVERQIQSGVSGIVPCGTTGESPTLSHKEHGELIENTVKFVNGRIQIIAGTGSNSTREAIDLTVEACKAGVDAVMLVNPYYNKPSQEGLYMHFKTVAEASTKPVMLYNIKGRTSVNLEVPTLVRLSEVENIQAVKEASGDPGQMAKVQKSCGDKIVMLSGDDNIIPAVMGLGGKGVVSVASNLFPGKIVSMMNEYLKGDFHKGNEIFYSLLDFMNALFWETNPIPVKAGAEIMGLCSGSIRLPLVELDSDKKEKLKVIIQNVGADQ
ncbi:MAG: 4-hydroxy-tetrahydrodipicolinate synthase [Spirochaetia bacterium]|nr:4-hydroxy-tetrahydrodipicolinate synthase [Spirochaetia bacterium]